MKDLYADVVVGGQPPPPKRNRKPRKTYNDKEEGATSSPGDLQEPQEKTDDSDNSSNDKGKIEGKDEMPQSILAQRAEKMAEDPYMTQAEMKNMDGGSKEKEKKADKSKDKERNKTRQKEIKESKKDLDIIASRSNKILMTAKAIFPFDFFPNTITIDANKVNIIIKTFFFTETVTSILLKEIMDVRVEITLFMGKLIIDYGPHPLKIWTVYVPALWKSDALKAKEIIEGMLVAYRGENIDTTKLKPEETLQEIKNVGKVDDERP